MVTEADPIRGNWYAHLDKGQRFVVVALDEDRQLVEIQHFDGDLEEVELNLWYEMEVEPAEPPENWSGPVDVAETDDLGTEVTDTTPADWAEPLQEIKTAPAGALPDKTEEENQWGEGHAKESPWEGEL